MLIRSQSPGRRRRALLYVGAVVAAVLSSSVAALPAQAGSTSGAAATAVAAKPKCYGSTCNGKDPQTMGCAADATSLEDVIGGSDPNWPKSDRIELRWSPKCQAVWTRQTNRTYSSVATSGALAWYSCYEATTSCRIGIYRVKQDVASRGDVGWTNMRDFSHNWYRACLGAMSGSGFAFCTAAH
jgi:uncharacterized membrane protein